MKTVISICISLALVAGIYMGGCSYRNIEEIKNHSEAAWRQAGFEIVGYEGYEIGSIFGQPGGKVWYTVKRGGNDKVIYHGFLSKWGNEFHIYNLTAIDAISPK